MIKPKLVLYNGNKDAKGRSSISVYISRPFRIYIGSGFFALPDEWDDKTAMYTGRNARAINSSLEQQLSSVIRKLTELRETGRLEGMTAKGLREEMSGIERVEKGVTLEEMIRRVAETKAKSRRYALLAIIKNIRQYGEEYLRMPLDKVTRLWAEGFSRFLLESGRKRNCVADKMTSLKHVLGIAFDEGLIDREPLSRLKVSREETPSRALDLEMLRTIWHGDFGNRNYYRDIFKLCFLLLGINISDLLDAELSNIHGGRLEYRRNKTGHLFSVKIPDEAMEIINRIKGEKKLVGLGEAEVIDLTRRVNYHLHLLGPKGKPIFPELTTYWARHTWATLAADLDISEDIIAEALGHKNMHTGAKVTGVYVRYKLYKVDDANRRVIDYVLEK